MHINDFPYEILSNILEETARLNEEDGVTFTFGLTQAPLPLQKTPLQKYVRGLCPRTSSGGIPPALSARCAICGTSGRSTM